MRLKLKFELERNELPIEYRKTVLSFFKHSLNLFAGIEAVDEVYKNGEVAMKPFTFAVGFFGAKFQKNNILLERNCLMLNFSTYDVSSAITFYNAFLKQKSKWFPLADSNKMKLISVKMQNEKLITGDYVKVKFLSPLLVRQHNKETNKDRYLTYGEEGFDEVLRNIIRVRIKKIVGLDEKLADGFSIEEIKNKRTVIKHYSSSINATLGTFNLKGNPILLNYLYQGGIGSRSSAGFGFIEII